MAAESFQKERNQLAYLCLAGSVVAVVLAFILS